LKFALVKILERRIDVLILHRSLAGFFISALILFLFKIKPAYLTFNGYTDEKLLTIRRKYNNFIQLWIRKTSSFISYLMSKFNPLFSQCHIFKIYPENYEN